MDKIKQLQRIIDENNNIVFFTGAGFSTASGISDFKSIIKNENGLGFEEILSHDYFCSHTKEFYEFYKKNLINLNAVANIGHKFVASLEHVNKLKVCITQNIDGLHTDANCINTIELHGTIHNNYCVKCNKFYDVNYIMDSYDVPKCSCGGVIKCDVVLYDEMLNEDNLKRSVEYIYNADVLIVAGTSLNVYPAAGLLKYYRGNKLVIINKDNTGYNDKANLVINDDICKVLSQIKIK